MSKILITGSSGGIGAAAAVALARAGHEVLITGRSAAKLAKVHRAMRAAAPDGTKVPEPIQADLASLAQVRTLAATTVERFGTLDVLINNAAVQPRHRCLSEDGHELGFAVNHLAHQLLTTLLSESLAGGRVITTSSDEHASGEIDFDDIGMEKHWSAQDSYARSKLANILFTIELRKRTGLPATTVHPGSVATDLNRDVPLVWLIRPFEKLLMLSPSRGAETLVWLATDPEGAAPAGDYYIDRRPAETSPAAQDEQAAARLWEASERLIGTVR